MGEKGPIAILILLAAFEAAGCQELPAQDVPILQLKVKEKLLVSNLVRNLRGIRPLCDDGGNLYYRPMGLPATPSGTGSIVRISSDGHKLVTFDLTSVPNFGENLGIAAWTVGLRGEVHVLAYKAGDPYLLHFDEEGEFESADKLDSKSAFFQMAVFPTGELLAAGIKVRNETLEQPYTTIFDRNGKLIKELTFPGDVKRQKDDPGEYVGAIVLGEEIPAEDGNIYLMRYTEKHLIFVISPAGEVVRKLALVPPQGDWDGLHFFVAGGKIAMEFFKPGYEERNSGTIMYSLYDAESGERQVDYTITPETSGTFACYSPNEFTFLTVQDEGLSIVHAVPK